MTFLQPDFTISDGRYFTVNEFRCRGQHCCNNGLLVNARLIELMDAIREAFHAPLRITSGFRCSVHNAKVNGSRNSQHMLGRAADFRPLAKDMARFPQLVRLVDDFAPQGLGVYARGRNSWIHADVRDSDTLSRWGDVDAQEVPFALALARTLEQEV